MTDLKHYGNPHRRAADNRLDGFLTGVAWVVVCVLVVFYGLGAAIPQ